ncbi:acetylene hydratase [Gottschalkia purinilytica]|uniref:Acetylene hydratase n=1 Tax=Gottschalkia purinilytica TaxID=1503 RepID=A0A0L0WF73_GOTPU|nr:molybdopterin-dependent oxidoreductase [Gottschalkia purinilytica]KNF10081.1 acetylene hydratase [Gottschalkia purinilytica]
MDTINTICGVCPGGCAVEVNVEDGELLGIRPAKDSPFSALCVRGSAAKEVVYSPDRLKKPLIRSGKKGDGEFREASWDEALDFISDKMKYLKDKYGAQCMVTHYGRGGFEQSVMEFNNGNNAVSAQFLWEFGSPNNASVGSVCYTAFGLFAPITTYGIPFKNFVPDIDNSNLIVVWGANPATDSPPFAFHKIVEAKKQGKKIIAIDHMKSDIANRADEWIAVRSGTDGALALGLINVIIQEELYDKEFVENWTVGFEELKEYVKQFTPEKVEEISWVPREKVIWLAREIASANNATLRTYTGLEYTNSGVQNIRAVFILWAITGNIDVPGGLYIQSSDKEDDDALLKKLEGIETIGAKKYPIFNELTKSAQFMEFPKAVLEADPYPVKGLIIDGSSTLTSYPQPEIFEKAYKELELMVVIDRFMTKDALYADVVLPATTYFEIDSYQYYPGYVRLRKKVIEPIGEAKNDVLIFGELAKRLGFGDSYPQTEDEIIKRAFAKEKELLNKLENSDDGVKLDQVPRTYKKYEKGLLRHDAKPGFPTPSGKLEIKSSLLEKYGYEPLPKYIDPMEGPMKDPKTYGNYPLILNTGARIQSTFRSQHLNIPKLLKIQEKPLVLINPKDAEARNIKDGDKVIVKTKRGEVVYYADVSDKVLPGAVEVNQGGGTPVQAKEWSEANVNILTDFYNRDYISGFPVFKALLCEVELYEDTDK